MPGLEGRGEQPGQQGLGAGPGGQGRGRRVEGTEHDVTPAIRPFEGEGVLSLDECARRSVTRAKPDQVHVTRHRRGAEQCCQLRQRPRGNAAGRRAREQPGGEPGGRRLPVRARRPPISAAGLT